MHEAEATKVFMENSTSAKINKLNYHAAKSKEKLPEPLRRGRKKR